MTTATAEATAARRVPRQRRVPDRNAALADVGLVELRAYRQAAIDEETRVSYWRRLVQARLDLLRAGDDGSDLERLRKVLAGSAGVGRRQALVRVLPVDDMPPLPDLGELWTHVTIAEDDRDDSIRRLEDVEAQLSEYRTALHNRIGEVTQELVARYRAEPTLCLDLLPLEPPAGRRRAS